MAKILDWAKVKNDRTRENPARWAGRLEHLLAARSRVHKVENHPALPWEKMAEFMSELRAQEGLAARCLEFTILTAAHGGESRGMPWEGEIAGDVWIVPGHRMKRHREHRVPLTAPALAIIEYMRNVRQNDYVFPGDKPGFLVSALCPAVTMRRRSASEESVQT